MKLDPRLIRPRAKHRVFGAGGRRPFPNLGRGCTSSVAPPFATPIPVASLLRDTLTGYRQIAHGIGSDAPTLAPVFAERGPDARPEWLTHIGCQLIT